MGRFHWLRFGAVVAVSMVVSACIALGAETHRGADGAKPSEIALYPTVKALPGALQAYMITSSVRTLIQGGDRFSAELGEVEEESFEISVVARYTVLEPGSSGEVRLRVEARAIDRSTLRPVALPPWEGVLRLAPSETVWEESAMPTWIYELGVSLDWLREWMTSPADVPADVIGVGARWEAVAHIGDDPRFAEFEFNEGAFSVIGKYQKSFRPAASAPPVASIVESYSGRLESSVERVDPDPWCLEEFSESTSMELYTRWIEECLDSVVAASLPTAMDLHGVHQLQLVRDDFPWSGRSRLTGNLIFAMDEAPLVTLEFTTEVVRHDHPFEQGEIKTLTPGAPQTEVLDAHSWIGTMYGVPSGAPADMYSFRGVEGDGAKIEMSSSDFTPYLVLVGEDGNVIRESYGFSDDERADVFVTLPYSGTYFVQATTSSGQISGGYTIALEVGPEVAPPTYFGEDDPNNQSRALRDVKTYDMDVCAPIPFGDESLRVIEDPKAFEESIRHDATRAYCLERLEPPDFERYVLVGVGFDSGWCVTPPGLEYEVWLYPSWGDVEIYIDYERAETPCRRSSWNELWLLVERPPTGEEWSYVAFANGY